LKRIGSGRSRDAELEVGLFTWIATGSNAERGFPIAGSSRDLLRTSNDSPELGIIMFLAGIF
jgi:hypothetical protein